MKRFIILFLLAPIISFAQEATNKGLIGFKISPGLALASNDQAFTALGYKASTGGSMQVGLRYHKPYSKLFEFGSEVLFHWKNMIYRKRNPNVTTICISGPCDKEDEAYYEHHFNSSSIDLNVYGTVHSGLGYANPYLLIGVNPSVLLKGKYKYNDWSTSGYIAKETWFTGNAKFESLSLGVVTGIGTKMFLFNRENMVEIRYLFYPNAQIKGLDSKISIFNWGWTIYFNQ